MKYLVHAQSHDGTSVVDHYWSTGGFNTKPTDTPANTEYQGRIIDPGNWEAHLFQARRTRGRSETTAGVIELNNADGALNGLWNHGWGRKVEIYSAPDSAKTLAEYTLLATHTSTGAERIGRTRVRILIQDKMAIVADKAMNANKFLGTNSGPSGAEGLATDLKGKPKPTLWGEASALPVPQVNEPKLLYQVSDTHAQSISVSAISDSGASLTFDVSQANLTALVAATVPSTKYDISLGGASEGAYFRLGSTPSGIVVVTATEGNTAADRTVAQIIKRILKGPGGLSDSDLDLTSFTALDTATSWVVGYWTGPDEEKVGDVIDALCQSINAFWYVKPDGKIAVGKFKVPTLGESVASLTQEDILQDGFEIGYPGDFDNGTPPWRITVEYARNFYVFSEADFAGTVTQAVRQPLLQEYLKTDPADNNTLKTKHPLSTEFVAQTLLRTATDAAAFRAELVSLYGTERELATIPVPFEVGSSIDLNEVVDLTDDHFEWSSTPFRVIGRIHEYARNRIVLICWR